MKELEKSRKVKSKQNVEMAFKVEFLDFERSAKICSPSSKTRTNGKKADR